MHLPPSDTLFNCPICQSPLIVSNKTWQCRGITSDNQRQHCFDVARQGYVNLLPVQQKKSKHPGDSHQSIMARQRFLQTGFYQSLQQRICELIQNHLTVKGRWLDIGCGEGYYTQAMANIDTIEQLIAIDISKSAVSELAKVSKQQQMLWSQHLEQQTSLEQQTNSEKPTGASVYPLVASASKLPLNNQSVQGISSIFSPIFSKEIAHVLAKQGILLLAKPDIGHLASMRAGLFDEVREHNSDKFLQDLETEGLQLIYKDKLFYEFMLNQTQLADLLTMTPYSYRAKAEKRQALLTQTEKVGLLTQGAFVIYVLQKTH